MKKESSKNDKELVKLKYELDEEKKARLTADESVGVEQKKMDEL